MAKRNFAVTQRATSAIGDLEQNTLVSIRAYTAQDGSLKFATDRDPLKATFPASTIAVFDVKVHVNKGGKVLFPTKAMDELKKDLLEAKLVDKKEVERLRPGKYGQVFIEGAKVMVKKA